MKPIAYVSHPLSEADKKIITQAGFKVVDMAFAPAELPEGDRIFDLRKVDEAASGGQSDGSGGLSTVTPPVVNPNIGTDSGDGLSDDQLRDAITEATGTKPHHKTGREKLVETFNALNLEAAKSGTGE